MRNLFLLLALINLGVLAWFSWIVPEPPPPENYDGPGITLLREQDAAGRVPARLDAAPDSRTGAPPESRPAPTPPVATPPLAALVGEAGDLASAATDAAPSAPRCVAIGPFTEASQADTARATLVEAGFEPTLSVSEDEVWDGYWVYVGRLADRPAANAALGVLAENGLSDAYIIPNSDSGILISLGVYSDLSRAGTLADRVGDLGFDTTITERTRTAETRWLELRLSGEESEALELLQEPGRIRRLEQRGCAGDAGD